MVRTSNLNPAICKIARHRGARREECFVEDKYNVLSNDKPFTYKLLKDEKAQIFWKNKQIMILVKKDYLKLQREIARNDEYSLQMFLAKITGHFKHGNEN
jgi:hypothetical protein